MKLSVYHTGQLKEYEFDKNKGFPFNYGQYGTLESIFLGVSNNNDCFKFGIYVFKHVPHKGVKILKQIDPTLYCKTKKVYFEHAMTAHKHLLTITELIEKGEITKL